MARYEFTQWSAKADFSDGVWSAPVLVTQTVTLDRINWGSLAPITPESVDEAIDTLIEVMRAVGEPVEPMSARKAYRWGQL